MYFQTAVCDVAQCHKAEEVFLPAYSLSSLALYEREVGTGSSFVAVASTAVTSLQAIDFNV